MITTTGIKRTGVTSSKILIMKTNIFVQSLLALVKTLVATIVSFLLLILFFNDSLDIFRREEETFLYIFLGIFLYSVGCIVYVFSILLPAYYIDRRSYESLTAHEIFSRQAPIITMITTLFCGLAILIAGENGMREGIFICNIFNVYVMSFAGQLFYVYQLKRATARTAGNSGSLPPGMQP
jgi:hypothetical protein